MANINGLSIKKVRSFVGPEGHVYQGDLYLGKKKIAFWSQDANGGIEDHLTMEPEYSEAKLRKAIIAANSDKAIVLHPNGSNNSFTIDYDIACGVVCLPVVVARRVVTCLSPGNTEFQVREIVRCSLHERFFRDTPSTGERGEISPTLVHTETGRGIGTEVGFEEVASFISIVDTAEIGEQSPLGRCRAGRADERLVSA